MRTHAPPSPGTPCPPRPPYPFPQWWLFYFNGGPPISPSLTALGVVEWGPFQGTPPVPPHHGVPTMVQKAFSSQELRRWGTLTTRKPGASRHLACAAEGSSQLPPSNAAQRRQSSVPEVLPAKLAERLPGHRRRAWALMPPQHPPQGSQGPPTQLTRTSLRAHTCGRSPL
ncbi:hypothetical protein GWK47_050402 [Chionoecetes opilio]|uniref:Uncharacterized protein n=1 Tax=Chionoecetes opilio TaxID=41210 RepID=A0A8J5CSU6_CHIOP|nr:hypothetical protein GWK47_050402 [Chionoecetes opilio]